MTCMGADLGLDLMRSRKDVGETFRLGVERKTRKWGQANRTIEHWAPES